MSIYGVEPNHVFLSARLTPPKSEHRPLELVRLHFNGVSKWGPSHLISEHKFVVRAASASSSPMGSDYSEQLQGAKKPNRKSKRIADIDQDEIEDPSLLADSDSCFCEFNGVQLHHKISDADSSSPDTSMQESAKRVDFPMILLHGFGASVFSWNRVMKPLAKVTGSKILAFDRPAFGLTSRVNAVKHKTSVNQDSKHLNPYSMMFSVLATLHFIDFLAAQKVVLVGHSAGALVALDAYFDAPERVAALILVAPAILAPFTTQSVVKENQESSGSNTSKNLFSRLGSILSKFTKNIVQAIVYAMKGMSDMISSLYKKALSSILRSSVGLTVIRMAIDKFGTRAVRSAWYDSSQVSDHVLQGYTKPLKVKGWDKALVEYTVALLTDSASESKPPLAKRLGQISCPVLIVTGDTDRLVPSWNAEKLSRAISGSCFEIIKKCGHLPQEEKPEEFVDIVDKFLRQVFGVAQAPRLQVVS